MQTNGINVQPYQFYPTNPGFPYGQTQQPYGSCCQAACC